MTKFYLSILSLFFFFSNLVLSQTIEEKNKKFDSIYYDTAVNVAGKDINKAIKIADSLYQHSTEDLYKIKTLMLSSSLFQHTGDSEKAIQYALIAEELANKNKLYEWQARTLGFLSTQYRKIGLQDKGRAYLKKGIVISKRITDEDVKNYYLGMVYQESAYYDLHNEEYLKAKQSVDSADKHFHLLSEGATKSYVLGMNEELAGRVFLNLKKYDVAYQHYRSALSYVENVIEKDAAVNGFIYSGLGQVYFFKKDYENAFIHLNKAEKIAKSSEFINLKLEVYKTLSEYYKVTKDYANYSLYNEMYIETKEIDEKSKKKSVVNFVNFIETENLSLSQNQNVLFLVSILITVVFVILFLVYRYIKKKEFKRFKLIIDNLKNNSNTIVPIEIEEDILDKDKKKLMSPEAERKILKDIEDFEKTKKFTDKNISLSVLAGLIDTNTKYLSYVLNKHKAKDFNNYINELRIKYIIHKIEDNNVYKNYKISYLAEEAGFSSHSKFSAIFKSVTGFTPSRFLEYLEKSKVENQSKS